MPKHHKIANRGKNSTKVDKSAHLTGPNIPPEMMKKLEQKDELMNLLQNKFEQMHDLFNLNHDLRRRFYKALFIELLQSNMMNHHVTRKEFLEFCDIFFQIDVILHHLTYAMDEELDTETLLHDFGIL